MSVPNPRRPQPELIGADVPRADESCAFHPDCPPHGHHPSCGSAAQVVLLFAAPAGQGHHRLPVCAAHAPAAARSV